MNPRFSMRPVAVTTAAALVVVAFLLVGAITPTSDDQAAAKSAVSAAITDIADPFRLSLAPGTGGKAQLSGNASSMHLAMASKLASHFSGNGLTRWQASLDEALDRQIAGGVTVSLGGGISSIAFDTVNVNGTSATASGAVHTWGDYADPAVGQVEHGTGYYSFQAELVRVGASWLVSSIDLTPINV